MQVVGSAILLVLAVGPTVLACNVAPPNVEAEAGEVLASHDDKAIPQASDASDLTEVQGDGPGATPSSDAGAVIVLDATAAHDAIDATDTTAMDASDASVDAGNTCSLLANTASAISQMDLGLEMPAGTGGAIVDGIYFRTKDTVFTGWHGTTGPTGYVGRGTLSVKNATTSKASLESVVTRAGLPDVRERFTLEPLGGVQANLNFACPAVAPYKVQYSVRNGATIELDLYVGPNRIVTLTRQ